MQLMVEQLLPGFCFETRGELEWATVSQNCSPTTAASRPETPAARSWRAMLCGSAASARAT
eukprot:4245387-Prymnesium_polylepis.1